jgi:hypothetical protein
MLGLPMGKVGVEMARDLCMLYSCGGMVDLATGFNDIRRSIRCGIGKFAEAAEVMYPLVVAQEITHTASVCVHERTQAKH